MKLVGIKEFYNITRAKIISAVNCCIVVTVCATATFAVDAALDATDVQAQPVETVVTSALPDQPDPSETDITASSDTMTETTVTVTVISMPSDSSETTDPTETLESSETSETSEIPEPSATTTSATTTVATTTTAKPTEAVTEKELYLAVYATTTINVRKGPGTEYDVVKSVYAGEQIDVIAVTSNGWYKTYNGNYVKKSLTTETKPTATPKPKPKATPTPTPKPSSTTAKPTEPKKPSGSGNQCTITFYGPQKMKDGSFSKSTATGTTCKQGRTCAADWSIYPAGTVIYIEDDPLGGDGYYTVEDRGPGVKGYHIDIYADDGESGNYATCKRKVIAT